MQCLHNSGGSVPKGAFKRRKPIGIFNASVKHYKGLNLGDDRVRERRGIIKK